MIVSASHQASPPHERSVFGDLGSLIHTKLKHKTLYFFEMLLYYGPSMFGSCLRFVLQKKNQDIFIKRSKVEKGRAYFDFEMDIFIVLLHI